LVAFAGACTLLDLNRWRALFGSRYFAFYEAFGLAAVMYLALVYGFIFIARRIESTYTDRETRNERLLPAGYGK
jgi:ABC-type arginine/histidine transport system permease subunit